MISYEDLEKYCVGKHFNLSNKAPKIYMAIKRRNGNCPCRVEEVMCPCPEGEEEIRFDGKCKCGLFVSKYYDPFPKFQKKYPNLFDIGGYFISFGFGEGWEPIVDEALQKIQKLNEELDEGHKIKIVQVKEKFGGLRIYTNFYTDATSEIIEAAERQAADTCENCGSTEQVTAKGGWIKNYCTKCHEQFERK
jgi:hypothetical protein